MLSLPEDVRDYPNTVSRAVTALRLAGVDGPYSLVLSADAYTAVNETSDHGYPIHGTSTRVIDGEIIWAPAIDGAFLLSARGGDFAAAPGPGPVHRLPVTRRHGVELYFQESLTFLVYTDEASAWDRRVRRRGGGRSRG